MSDISLLHKRKFVVNDKITVHIPTIGEIKGTSVIDSGTDVDEAGYYSLISLFSSTSTDIMLELDSQGIDFTKWSDFQTFLMLFNNTPKDQLYQKSPLLFDNINLGDFELSVNMENELPILYDSKHDVIIDELIYMRLSTIFCTINCTKKRHRKMGNDTAKEYAIEREKAHREHRKRKKQTMYSSQLDKQIIALVNNANFKYNFDEVNDLTIYDFLVSLKQVVKKYQIDNLNTGIYMGTVKVTENDRNTKLNWLDYE